VTTHRTPGPRLFGLGSWSETQRISEILRKETVGGGLLVLAALVALLLANSPAAGAYTALRDLRVGPEALHLDLTIGAWAADGLLAIFFFLVGLELKREFVAGDLRDPRRAMVPVLAAAGGVVVPALIYAGINLGRPELLRGWAIPTATDIAFAVAVLAVIGSHLPTALRTFLLTLAVVDDLIAIAIIAVFYTAEINLPALAATAVPVVLYALVVRNFRPLFGETRYAMWLILLPLGIVAWALLHASGIHATIAGVVLGLIVPVRRRDRRTDVPGLSEIFEHRLRPVSAGFAVPVFAFFSAGVSLLDGDGPEGILAQPVVLAIVIALVLGKLVGVLGTTALVTKLTPLRLPDAIGLRDLLPVGFLAGIGFTVSLLIAELSFPDTEHTDGAKIAILIATILAAILAATLLRWDARKQRSRDMNADGLPDQNTDAIE